MKNFKKVELSVEERSRLLRISRQMSAPYQDVVRAKVILFVEKGLSSSEIGRRVGLGRRTIPKLVRRYLEQGATGSIQKEKARSIAFKQKATRVGNILRGRPSSYGSNDQFWSLRYLASVYEKLHGEVCSNSTMSRLVKSTGYSIKQEQEKRSAALRRSGNKVGLLLSPAEREELKRVSNRWTARHYEVMRARIVLLADRGYSSEKIGRRLRISRKAVERWRKRYISQRIAGLKDKNRSPLSKESGVLEVRRKRVLAILHEQPKLFGINRSSWTFDALAIAYQQRHGEKFSKSTMHRLVKMSGYSFKKARRVLTSPDPDYREKVELLLTTLRNLRGDEFLFFIDEMGPMRVKKYGGRSLVRKGETNTFPQQQKDKGSVIMSAALSATKNQVTWFYSPAKDTQAMIDLIEVLFNQHHTAGKLYLTWDAASWHSSAALVEWLDQFNAETVRSNSGPIIQIIPLPTSSQFLDVLEAVFSGMKRAVIHHSDYADKNAMKAAISKHFSDRNEFFVKNPRRAGKKIWELDFFEDIENIKSGNYREW